MQQTAPSESELGATAYSGLVSAMLADAREEVGRADLKANVLAAMFVALQVVLLTAMASGSWSPLKLAIPMSLLFYLGWAASIGGVIAVGLCLYPRTSNKHDGCITYFGQVAACKTIGEMRHGLEKAVAGTVTRDEEQLWTISRIVSTKYAFIQWSMRLTLLGALMCVAAVAIGR